MKIRHYENLVLFFDVCFGIVLFFIVSFAYFLGFPVNKNTLLYYFLGLVSILVIIAAIYLSYILLCKTYILFTDKEIIKKRKYKSNVLVKYGDIIGFKYYNIFSLFINNPHGGNLEIVFLNEDKKIIYFNSNIEEKFKKVKINKIWKLNIYNQKNTNYINTKVESSPALLGLSKRCGSFIY